jgi:hypothetical protein
VLQTGRGNNPGLAVFQAARPSQTSPKGKAACERCFEGWMLAAFSMTEPKAKSADSNHPGLSEICGGRSVLAFPDRRDMS